MTIKSLNFVSKLTVFFLCIFLFDNCDHGINGESTVSQEDINSSKVVTLKVRREKNTFLGRTAKINVWANEIALGNLANGEEKVFYFSPTKSGFSNLRFESSNIASSALVEGATKDTTIVNSMRKEIRVRAKKGDEVQVFCTFAEKGIFVRQVEN